MHMNINFKKILISFLVVVFAMSIFSLSSFNVRAGDVDKIEDVEDEIDDLADEAKKVEKDLQNLQPVYQQKQNQVYSTQSAINETETEISRKESEIEKLEKKIKLDKKILGEYVRQLYIEDDSFLIFKFITSGESLSNSFQQFDSLVNLKSEIVEKLEEIDGTKNELAGTKEELVEKKEEHEELLDIRVAEKNAVGQDIVNKKATLSEINKKMSELKSDLSRILGKAYDTGEIKDAIKFANKVTGVSKGFIFGVLSMESGGNPLAGGCNYKNCDMTSSRKDYFKDICDDLGFSSSKCKKMPLSCASKSYPGSGGAMGAAQFMSDTWWGWKDRIAAATGHNPPDPWNLLDGIVAMALKLESHGAADDGTVSIKNPCDGKSVKVKWEIYASMRYLGWTCYGYTHYAPGIQNLKDGYDDL